MKENEKEEEGEVEDKMKRRNLGVIAHSFDPSTQKTGRMVSRIKASLVHIVSSRSVGTTQSDLSQTISHIEQISSKWSFPSTNYLQA